MTQARALPLVLLSIGLAAPATAGAQGDIRPPTRVIALGDYGGIAYAEYWGLFCMNPDDAGACESLVPYRVIAPSDPDDGIGVTVFESSHFAGGTNGWYLGPEFLFSRGFTFAAVGTGTWGYNALDPEFPVEAGDGPPST